MMISILLQYCNYIAKSKLVWRKPKYPGKSRDLSKVNDKTLSHTVVYRVYIDKVTHSSGDRHLLRR